MRVLLQRVKNALVEVDLAVVSKIDTGLLLLLGVAPDDTEAEIEMLVEKIANLRIFEDENHKMNFSLLDTKGQVLVVSQFTLYADCRKGRRPSFTDAAPTAHAQDLYNKFVQAWKTRGVATGAGVFGADMDVSLTNCGPVTIWMDTKEMRVN